jgi:hypothetical protein
MNRLGGIFGLALSGVLFTVACAAGNLFLPPLILEWWIRDADVGLWYCAGILMTQLSIPGWLCYFRIATVSTRLLIGSVFALICIFSAWGGFLLTGPVSRADSIAFLIGVFVPVVAITVIDLFAVRHSRCRIAHHSSSMDAAGRSEWSFGLASLFGWVIVAACVAGLWSYGMRMNATAFRDVRGYFFDAPYLTMAKLAWLILLHFGAMFVTLSIDSRWAWSWLLPCVILGLEGMRRLQFYSSGTVPIYLEWDFAMLTLGFVTGQFLLGSLLRFLGWTLRCG